MRPRKNRLLFFLFLCLYLAGAYGYVLWSNTSAEQSIIRSVDNQLEIAARSLPLMLASDFHDRATTPYNVSLEEELENRKLLNTLVEQTDLVYLYTLAVVDGRYYFSAPTVTESEAEKKKRWYFLPYEDVPDSFVRAYLKNETSFTSYTDQWGSFRSVAIPFTSPGGIRYLACADYEIGYLQKALWDNTVESIFVACMFLLISLPMILLSRAVTNRLSEANRQLLRHRSELEDLVSSRTRDLVAAKEKAEAADLAKSDFLARMSHEIRSPLHSIIGAAELLSETRLDGRQQRYQRIFHTSGEYLLDLVSNVLDLAKIESGKLELAEEDFSLHDVIRNVCGIMEPKALQKGLQFNLRIGDNVPKVVVGDSLRLRQVLLNLVQNSLKFTHTGHISITVEAENRSDGSSLLKFRVADTGIGIPEDKQKMIFDHFTQVDISNTRAQGGSGLGLPICKTLVGLMGGGIAVESEQEHGTTFRFTARVGRSGTSASQLVDALPHHTEGVVAGFVLAVDDAPDNLLIVRHFLRDEPVEVVTAANGAEGLALFRDESFDLVLMDIQMPVMDGYEAVGAIRQFEKENGREPTPILALTANAFVQDSERSIAAGFTAHLTKPVTRKALIDALLEYLPKK